MSKNGEFQIKNIQLCHECATVDKEKRPNLSRGAF